VNIDEGWATPPEVEKVMGTLSVTSITDTHPQAPLPSAKAQGLDLAVDHEQDAIVKQPKEEAKPPVRQGAYVPWEPVQ
jgi:hypothetical protein